MFRRQSEPSPSWLINQAFLSVWVAFAAGVSVVGFLLVSNDEQQTEEVSCQGTAELVAPAPGPQVPFAENADAANCQILLRVSASEQHAQDPAVNDQSSPEQTVAIYRMGQGETQETRLLSVDASGWYFASDVLPGTYHVTAARADGMLAASEPLTCAGDGARIHRELRFPKQGVWVRGKIRGYENKFPGNSEMLIQQENAGGQSFTGVAHVALDEKGQFAFRVPAGRYKWVAVAPFHAGKTQAVRLPARLEGQDQGVRLPITLQWRPEVSGRVVDGTGAPVAGAEIFLGPMFDPKIGFSSVTSSEDGTFKLPIIKDQKELLVASRTDDAFGVTRLPKVSTESGISDIEIVLKEGRSVRGYVQTQAGQIKPYADVAYRIRSLGILSSVQANADGAFQIRGLPLEDVEIWPENSALGAWGGAVATLQKNSVLLTYQAPAY